MPLTNNRDDISRAIIKLTKDGNLESLKKAIDELEPSEVAAQYRRLPRKRHPIFLEVLDTDKLIKMLGSLTRNEQLRVLELVGPIRSTELLDQMKSEDLSYLLSDLPDKQVEKLIAEMRQEEKSIFANRESIQKILQVEL